MIGANDEVVRQARPGKPSGLLNLKLALGSLPPEEAFTRYCALMGVCEPLRLDYLRATSMYSFARARAKVFSEVWRSGEPFVNRAPKVMGESNHRDLVCTTRAFYVACIENARIWGRSSSIEASEDVLFDFEDWELARFDDQFEQDPRVFRSDCANIWYMRDPSPDANLHVARGFKLTGSHAGAFGHWMWEYLPKYVAALATNCLPNLTVLIDAKMAPTHKQALERLVPSGSDILEVEPQTSVRVDELWCAPTLYYEPMLAKLNGKCPWDFSATPVERYVSVIKRMVSAYFGDDRDGPHAERVYLARHARRHRKLVNHEAIEATARERGFMIVNPEEHSFADQIALIRSARHIMAPEGSATALVLFARPGTKLAILSHPDTEGQASITAVLEALGIAPVILTGPVVCAHAVRSYYSDYEIPHDRYERFLAEWLG